MEGRFYDGLTAAPWPAQARVEAGDLVFEAAGQSRRWPLHDLDVARSGDVVRIAFGLEDARLVLPASAWSVAAAEQGRRVGRGGRRRALKIAVGVGALSAALFAFIFFGVPLAAGPLARATPPALERRLGATFQGQLETAFKPCPGAAGQAALQGLADRLQAASASRFDIRVRAVEAPMANAFALPGGAVLVTGDLIEMAGSGDELAAVIAHEVAHVEERHVMRSVWRYAGLGVMLDLLVGGGGAGQQALMLAGAATDLSFSRADEAQADARGMTLLSAAGLTSAGMAPFFENLAKTEGGNGPWLEMLSDHPDVAGRAKSARAAAKGGRSAFTPAEWAAIRAACPAGPKDDAASQAAKASLHRQVAE